MAKQRHQDNQTTSSRTTLVALAVGALIVAALVGWALTRTVEPAATTPTAAVNTFPTSTAPAPDATTASATTATTASMPTETSAPIASTSAPLTIPPEHSQSADKAAIARVAAEDLREKMNAGSVTVIDVRDAGSYAAGHIQGARNIPYASIEANLDLIPKGKDVVTYCT
jgi:cytoskeletal protein RodZ